MPLSIITSQGPFRSPLAYGRAALPMSITKTHEANEIERLERRLDERPSDVKAHIELGLLRRSLGQHVAAAQSLNAAIEHDTARFGSEADGYQHYGELMFRVYGEYKDAEVALRKMLALDAARHSGWRTLSSVLRSRALLNDARKAMQRACALAPSESDYHAELAEIMRATGHFQSAHFEFGRAAALGWTRDQSLRYALGTHTSQREVPQYSSALDIPRGALWLPMNWKQPRLSTVYKTCVATPNECAWVIREAEHHAQKQGGWDTLGHHQQYRTTDVVVADCAPLLEWINSKLLDSIWPAMAAQFAVGVDELWLQDAFVVRYESTGQAGLPMHLDDSELSFNLLLSASAGFEGGGTVFKTAVSHSRDSQDAGEVEAAVTEDRTVVRLARGEMISHFGGLFHGGQPVTSGVRYILAGFVRCRSLALRWRTLWSKRPNSLV